MLEKDIEKQILCFLEECAIFAWKNETQGTYDVIKKVYRKSNNRFKLNGVSDILGILPDGRFLAIEVKSETGKPSQSQKDFINKINDNFGVSFISRSVRQTYMQLISFYPAIKAFDFLLRKYDQLNQTN